MSKKNQQLVLVPKSSKLAKVPPKPQPQKKNSVQQRKQTNISLSATKALRRPYFKTKASSMDSCCVEGCEVLATVNTSNFFARQLEFSINPCNSQLFPRLAAIASAFEQYRVKKLTFVYDAQTNATQSGNIMHYVDYDPADAGAGDELEILNNLSSKASSCYVDSRIDLDLSRVGNKPFFVQSGASIPGNITAAEVRQDYVGTYRLYANHAKLADHGLFCGYVYVLYEVELLMPRPPVPISFAATVRSGLPGLAMGTNATLPLIMQSELSSSGLRGERPTDGLTGAYTGAGGVIGWLDWAKTVYEKGKWILSLGANGTAASFLNDVKGDHSKDWHRVERDSEEKVGEISSTAIVTTVIGSSETAEQVRARRAKVNDAAGDIYVELRYYDVTDGHVDPDFPITVNGMTAVTTDYQIYQGTGSVLMGFETVMNVPDGKLYMVQPFFHTGSAAGSGRTLSNVRYSANAFGVADS